MCDTPSLDIAGEECLLQDIVNEVLVWGVWIMYVRQLHGQVHERVAYAI